MNTNKGFISVIDKFKEDELKYLIDQIVISEVCKACKHLDYFHDNYEWGNCAITDCPCFWGKMPIVEIIVGPES